VTRANDAVGILTYCESPASTGRSSSRMNVSILLFGVVLILGSLLAATYALFR
jgi:hypothetical protein